MIMKERCRIEQLRFSDFIFNNFPGFSRHFTKYLISTNCKILFAEEIFYKDSFIVREESGVKNNFVYCIKTGVVKFIKKVRIQR